MYRPQFRRPFAVLRKKICRLPTPRNLTVFWRFGSLLGLSLVMQIVTGFLLTAHYIPHEDHAFNSCIHIMRNVKNGWLIRSLHANGASLFFLYIYIHIGRGLYYVSYSGTITWV